MKLTGRVAEKPLTGGRLCSLLYLCELAPIMLPFKCFVTGERASYSGLLLLWADSSSHCCFKSLILTSASVWRMFPVNHTLFIYGIFSDTYLHHYHPLSCKVPKAASEGACFTKATFIQCSQDRKDHNNMENQAPQTKGCSTLTAFKSKLKYHFFFLSQKVVCKTFRWLLCCLFMPYLVRIHHKRKSPQQIFPQPTANNSKAASHINASCDSYCITQQNVFQI